MATAQIDAENYDLECAVCTEILRDARLLRCGHHFCRVCLEQIAVRHSRRDITCPNCRRVTETDGKDGVDILPRYTITSEFSRRVKDAVERHGETVQPRKCDLCKEGDASKACLACCVCFCNSCISKHSNLEEVDTSHQLFPLSTHMFCSTHGHKCRQVFCTDCSKMCCHMCVLGPHQGHKLEKIEKRAEVVRAGLRQSRDNMDAAEKESDTTHQLQETLNRAVDIQKTFISSMTGLKQSLKEMLAKVETLEQEVDEKMKANIKLLEIMNTDMKDYLASKVKLRDHMTYLIETASDPEVVGLEREVPVYDKNTYRYAVSTAEVELPDLGNTLTDIQAQLDKLKHHLVVEYTTYSLCDEETFPFGYGSCPLADLLEEADIDVGGNVYGLAVDSNRKKLIVRRTHPSTPVSVYDFRGQRLQVLGQDVQLISSAYCQSVAIDTKRNLILLPMSNGSLVTMDTKGNVQDKLRITNYALNGVSYSDDDYYVTSSVETGQIYLVNPLTRQIVDTFKPNTTFKQPYNVCSGYFTVGGKLTPVIMVSDHGNHCIKVLDLSGSLLHIYGTEGKAGQGEGELNHPWGVCTDPGGRVVVGDRNNNRVVSFWREEGRDMSQVLLGPDKLQRSGDPSIIFDPTIGRLFLAYSGLTKIQHFKVSKSSSV